MDSVRAYKFTLSVPITTAVLSALMTAQYVGARHTASLFRALEVNDADVLFAQLFAQTSPAKVSKCVRSVGYTVATISRLEPSERPAEPKMTSGTWANGGRAPRAVDVALPEDPSKWTKVQLVAYVNRREQEDRDRARQEEEWRIQDQQLALQRAAWCATTFECKHTAFEAWNADLHETMCEMFMMSMKLDKYQQVQERAFERVRVQKGERPADTRSYDY